MKKFFPVLLFALCALFYSGCDRCKYLHGAVINFHLVEEVNPENCVEYTAPEGYKCLVRETPALKICHLQKAVVVDDQYGNQVVQITFCQVEAERFTELTRQNVGRRLAIIIDGKLYSAPTIHECITGNTVQISGMANKAEAEALVRKLCDSK